MKARFLAQKKSESTFLGGKTDHEVWGQLDPLERLSVLMADASYKEQRPEIIQGYKYDPEMSNKTLATYQNPQTKQVFISHRGTKPEKEDLYSDLHIATGMSKENDPRHVSNREQVNMIIDKYADNEFIHTGHSLGGSQSKIFGREFGHKNINFNSGRGLDQFVGQGLMANLNCLKPKAIRPKYCDPEVSRDIDIQGDIVSLIPSMYGSRKLIKSDIKWYDLLKKHKLSAFKPK